MLAGRPARRRAGGGDQAAGRDLVERFLAVYLSIDTAGLTEAGEAMKARSGGDQAVGQGGGRHDWDTLEVGRRRPGDRA
jgi:hypothetical protein